MSNTILSILQGVGRGQLALAATFCLFLAGVNSLAAATEDFIDLFDGETLNGWVKATEENVGANYAGGEWRVEHGAIAGYQIPPRLGSLLHTEKAFGDFELVIDINPDWGSDSGIFLRTNSRGRCIQVLVDYLPRGNVGFLFGQGSGGYLSMPWQLEAIIEGDKVVGVQAVDNYDGIAVDGLLYAATAEDFNRVWKHGEFNTLKIRIQGTDPIAITTWINGVMMMDMNGNTFRARGLRDMRDGNFDAPSAWDQQHVNDTLGARGMIGLQMHPGNRWPGTVLFKNIRIRELD
jgi:hypothetical protein